MKKILVSLLLLCATVGSTFAFSMIQLDDKREQYKIVLERKVGDKLDTLSLSQKQLVLKKVETLIQTYENKTDISDQKKLEKLALFLALKDILQEKIEFEQTSSGRDIIIQVISDKRCKNCNETTIINQLKQNENLKNAQFIYKDFSDEGVKKYLTDNSVYKLPLFVFNKQSSNSDLNSYLLSMSSGEYSLPVGANFDPYKQRSERGFLMIEDDVLDSMLEDSYIRGNKNAEILWLEYSDLECPFCAKLHNDGTPKTLQKKYGEKLAISLQHFPLDFHKNAQVGAEILECAADQKGSEMFYALSDASFAQKNSNKDFLMNLAVEKGMDKKELENCVENIHFGGKVIDQKELGSRVFGITGTPGNVLINTKTREYILLSGAYPADSFIEKIDSLLEE